jgi:hypothetical protein
MQNQIQNLVDAIVDDYRLWTLSTEYGKKDYDHALERVQEFANGVEVKQGNKYIKIEKHLGSQRTVWGFVVNVDNDKKFRRGDILMAAGYNAPARNAARGNVLDGDFDVAWAGPRYL